MLKAELRPAGSFIQNTPTTAASTGPARRPSLRATPSRRAESRTTPAAPQQAAAAVHEDEGLSQGEVDLRRRPQTPAAGQNNEGLSQGEVGQLRRPQRPSSAWKSRNRRPHLTDNFDAFDDPVIDLDVENLNLDDLCDAQTSATSKTGTDVIRPKKDLSHTPGAWQGDTPSGDHQPNRQSKPTDVAGAGYSRQVTSTSSENWTSCEDTPKRDSTELTPDFELSHIHARVLEKYRSYLDLRSLNVKVVNRITDHYGLHLKVMGV